MNKQSEKRRINGIKKKLKLVELLGGKCQICGYKDNLSALCFHHLNPKDKSFSLDMSKINSKRMSTLIDEAMKCQLLCHNCHMSVHHPNNNLSLINETIKHASIPG